MQRSKGVVVDSKTLVTGAKRRLKLGHLRGLTANFVVFAVDQNIFLNLFCNAVTKNLDAFGILPTGSLTVAS